MNDFSELEAELKQLRPAAPSPDLMTRIERALSEPQTSTPSAGVLPRSKPRINWLALGLGLAGATALFLLLARLDVRPASQTKQPRIASNTPAPAQTAATNALPSGFVPDGVTRVVYDTRNEGLVFPGNADQPVRRVRSLSRETVEWRNPQSGASLRVSYPAEDIKLIPVSGQ